MPNESEKLTVNLGVVELAQIDALAERGIYANRTDFIRSAVRERLERHRSEIEGLFEPVSDKKRSVKVIGIQRISRRSLEDLAEANERLSISVIGMLVIDSSVGAELFRAAVDRVFVRGKLVASDEIKEIIAKLN